MDKNMFTALGLSFLVVIGYYFLFPPLSPEDTSPSVETEPVIAPPLTLEENLEETDFIEEDGEVFEAKTVEVEVDKFLVTFNTQGATIDSLLLKGHLDGSKPIEMINRGATNNGGFGISFGDNIEEYIRDTYDYEAKGDQHIFTKTHRIRLADGSWSPPFQIKKVYTFFPDEYMFELKVDIMNSQNLPLPLNYDGKAYTLFAGGPQIGPEFEKIDGRQELREYLYLVESKKENVNFPKNGLLSPRQEIGKKTGTVKWAGVSGKYFILMGLPSLGVTETIWSTKNIASLPARSQMYFVRGATTTGRMEDRYRFYLGPKDEKILKRYNKKENNPLGIGDLQLNKVQSSFWGWLEGPLKFILNFFYGLIPNYGVAIIFLTILIKIIFFPITHKSYESTARMQALQPKIKALQDKYKSTPNKLNVEMANLYKKEGVNPLSGCLPMVLQLPIFFALYGLINKYFDLRGAIFIPGWITDLSAPESVFNFGSFVIPIVNINDLRLLPIFYLGSQLIMGRFMQPAGGGQSAAQMKMFTLWMPIMFFFILYNMPSGLLLYWTFSNMLTAAQQGYNYYKRKRVNL